MEATMDIGKTAALVTGASRGLGFELSLALARAGADVVMVARDEAALEGAASAVRAEVAGRGRVHPLAFDVGDKAAIHKIAGAAAALVGPIDLLVHAASTLGPLPMPALVDTDCEDLERVLQVNLVGPFRLTKAVVGSMALRGRGVVVFVSSDAAVVPYPGWGAYGVSKAAQDHLARIFAAELASVPDLRIFAVDPGEMDTKMHADAMPDADRSKLTSPAVVARRILASIERADLLTSGTRFEAT